MKTILTFLIAATLAHGATWYATSSANIDTASLWVPTSTGSCTGSGTALTWADRANGDVFNANGCTVAVNVDPGGASLQVTLTTDGTQGGNFTYATAANLTIHANVTATKTTALNITGGTGGGSIVGDIQGGSTSAAIGVVAGHTTVTITVTGNVTGGSAATAYGIQSSGSNGTTSISGILTPGTVHGVYCSNSSAYVNVTGTIKGSNTSTNANGFLNGGGSATITATLLNGLKSPAWGVGGVSNYYTPRATDYVLFAKDSSYTIGTIDSHAVVMPTDPGVANVKLGTAYGSFTGTLAGGGGAYVFVQ